MAFSSPSDQWEIGTSFTFFIFSKLFIYNYCFLYHGDQNISWWRICRWRAVNFEIHLCSFSVNSDLRECFFWGLCKPVIASTDLWPQEMFTFLEILAMVSESSLGAYVCHRRPAGLHQYHHQRLLSPEAERTRALFAVEPHRSPVTSVGTKTAFGHDQCKHFHKSKHLLRSEVSVRERSNLFFSFLS